MRFAPRLAIVEWVLMCNGSVFLKFRGHPRWVVLDLHPDDLSAPHRIAPVLKQSNQGIERYSHVEQSSI